MCDAIYGAEMRDGEYGWCQLVRSQSVLVWIGLPFSLRPGLEKGMDILLEEVLYGPVQLFKSYLQC